MIWLRTTIFLLVVPGTVLFAVPIWIGVSAEPSLPLGPLRWSGLVPIGLGAAILLWCATDFARKGRGTPAPIDPPKQLVVEGLYRYVRNPMYVGAVLVLIGHVLWFRAAVLLLYGGVVFLIFHLFVRFYEEPTLARQFGASYRAYCEKVPRWIPRRPGSEP